MTVTVTPSLVCLQMRQREKRGLQRHPASKSGPMTGSTASPSRQKHGQHRKSAFYADTVYSTRAYGTVAKDLTCCVI